MSTNFYFTPTEGPLTAFGELHIGLRSGGAQFGFQAYVENGGKRRVRVGSADLTMEVDVPPLVIKSWADWKELLRSTPGQIHDEYRVPYTVAEFEAEVAEHSPGVKAHGDFLRNQYDTLASNPARYGQIDPERNWKDTEGFSFSHYEFF